MRCKMHVYECDEWQHKMHHISIQDKRKIMQEIDTNSYLTNITQLTIESKNIKHDTILTRSQVS